jgi:adenine deaminase
VDLSTPINLMRKTRKGSHMDYKTFLKKIPKIELHCHLEGTLKATTFTDLASKNGVELPQYKEPIDLYSMYKSFQEFENIYRRVAMSIRDRDDFRRVTYETLQEAAGCNVKYRELFWSVMDHVKSGIPYENAVDGIIDGLHDAENDFGIQCRLIPAIDRSSSPEEANELAHLIIENRRNETIGIGLDYSESGNPPEKFWHAYRTIAKAGFHRTAHAGELGGHPRNIETCLDLLGCERIDHGYRILEDDRIVQKCLDRGIIFTVVPNAHRLGLTDDYGTVHWEKHPIIQMVAKGLRVTINSDDPGILKSNPTGAYEHAEKHMGFSPRDFRNFLVNAIDGSWVDDVTKTNWKNDWLLEFDNLIPEQGFSL